VAALTADRQCAMMNSNAGDHAGNLIDLAEEGVADFVVDLDGAREEVARRPEDLRVHHVADHGKCRCEEGDLRPISKTMSSTMTLQ